MSLMVLCVVNLLQLFAVIRPSKIVIYPVLNILFPLRAEFVFGLNMVTFTVVIILYIFFLKELKKALITCKDELTGVYNRRFGIDLMQEALLDNVKEKNRLCVVFIDIDHLKRINDTLGHTIGDQVIKTTLAFLNKNLKKKDLTFRLGGDEFVAVLPACSHLQAEQMMRRVCSDLASHNMTSDLCKCHFSYGIVETNRRKQMTVDDMLKVSDHRMYMQKNTKTHYNDTSSI